MKRPRRQPVPQRLRGSSGLLPVVDPTELDQVDEAADLFTEVLLAYADETGLRAAVIFQAMLVTAANFIRTASPVTLNDEGIVDLILAAGEQARRRVCAHVLFEELDSRMRPP